MYAWVYEFEAMQAPPPLTATPDAFARCADTLRSGSLVILPTDTVYGICADALNDRAVHDLYRAKGKGIDAPLQLLFGPSLREIERFATPGPLARRFVDALGAGAWTLIVPAAPGWKSPALAGGTTVGFRIPNAMVVHEVVRLLGRPVAASSANRHGAASTTTCAEALRQLGEFVGCALDGGPTTAGLDSTVIDLADESQPRILREGAIDRLTVARILDLPAIPVLRSVRP